MQSRARAKAQAPYDKQRIPTDDDSMPSVRGGGTPGIRDRQSFLSPYTTIAYDRFMAVGELCMTWNGHLYAMLCWILYAVRVVAANLL